MNEKDRVLLLHMRDAAREVLDFTTGATAETLASDRLLLRGVMMSVSIIGEAASKVSPELRSEHPEVPWALIVSTRNRLIHGYFDIRLERLWETVTVSVPELLSQLEAILTNSDDLNS